MKKQIVGWIIGLLLIVVLGQSALAQQYPPMEMGVNVNERPHWLKKDLLELSQTTWVRAFIEFSHYVKGQRDMKNDMRVRHLKSVAEDGYKVVLSIKWNLNEAGWRIPEPGSSREQDWLRFTTDLLNELEGDISILVLVNEITIDTPEKDLQPIENGEIPFVRFQKRLLDHISQLKPKNPDGNPLPIYTGGFTRLDKQELQDHPVNRAMFKWINEDDRLTGADYHIHQPDYKTSMESSNFIRKQIPEKPLIVTEFSFVWKWKAHLGDRIGATDGGRKFAEKYGIDSDITVADYCTRTFADRVPENQWHDFLKSQSWYEPDYLDILGRMMERHGVVVATYAFTQNPEGGGARNITPESNPWFMHQILMPQNVYVPNSDRTAINYGMHESFVRWQRVTNTLKVE